MAKQQAPLRWTTVKTRIGPVSILVGPAGVRRITLGTTGGASSERHTGAVRDDAGLAPIARAVARLVDGTGSESDVPVDLEQGSPFQRSVWRELTRIPRGQTVTYAELARRVGRPKAARAVGQAVGANPIPVVVPCHRVVASGGGLGGYGGGLDAKRRLLKAEGVG